jgi:hypothetical protein
MAHGVPCTVLVQGVAYATAVSSLVAGGGGACRTCACITPLSAVADSKGGAGSSLVYLNALHWKIFAYT